MDVLIVDATYQRLLLVAVMSNRLQTLNPPTDKVPQVFFPESREAAKNEDVRKAYRNRDELLSVGLRRAM